MVQNSTFDPGYPSRVPGQEPWKLTLLFRAATRSDFWRFCVDMYPFLVAGALPWSTTAVAFLVPIWFVVLFPTMEARSFFRTLRDPCAFLPIAFFALVMLGLLWSPAPWSERLHGLSPAAKLLVIPFLFYHFQHSTRGWWVFSAFLASCLILLVMSWVVTFHPGLSFRVRPIADYYGVVARGVPVKNYIDQSQEFSLCAIALAYPTVTLFRARRFFAAAISAAIVLGFVANMTFVVVSRTALITLPIMLAVAGSRYLGYRGTAVVLTVVAVFGGVALSISPQLRWKAETIFMDYRLYQEQNAATSIGERLELWRKSLGFISEAPMLGHGTGSIRELLGREPSNQHRPAKIIGNMHNQTLNVGVQWGMVGIAVLYAMWVAHLLLFRDTGFASWIGLLVVVQNICTSLFNSHLFDFVEGWMYVLGVGVAGGLLRHQQRANSRCRPACGPAESTGLVSTPVESNRRK